MQARAHFLLVFTSCALAAGLAAVREERVASAAPGGSAPHESIASAASRNASCASCHEAETRTWEKSQHHTAASDASYKTAVAIEPLAFCRGCHAPSADPNVVTPAAAEALGIGCIHCHDAPPTSAANTAGATTRKGPHGVMQSKSCASCHEFAFPDPPARLMQSTREEHARSAYATTSCTECHMKRDAQGQVDHASIVSSDPEMLQRAVKVRVTRASDTRIAVRLAPGAVGHAFPTGDLFRRLRVSVRALGDDGVMVAERHRFLQRHFGLLRSGEQLVRAETKDDRPGGRDAQACFEMALPKEASARPWELSLAYQRVDHPRSETELDLALVSQSTIVFKETLAPSSALEPCP